MRLFLFLELTPTHGTCSFLLPRSLYLMPNFDAAVAERVAAQSRNTIF
jgi:hypothetical protein